MDLVGWTIQLVEAQGAGLLDEQVALALLIGSSVRGAHEVVTLPGAGRIDARLRWPSGRFVECLLIAADAGWCTVPALDNDTLTYRLTLPAGGV